MSSPAPGASPGPETTTGDDGGDGVVGKTRRAFAWWQSTRVARALARYSIARGGLLAGGISYSALFSMFAALAIGWTAFMAVLGGNAELRQTVLDAVDDALPGIIDDGSGSGILEPEDLVQDTALNPGSIIAAAVLLWTALTVMSALKNSIRAMFAIVAPPENFAVSKVRDLFGFLVLALGVVLAAVLGIVAGTLGEAVLDTIGVEGAFAGFALRALGFAVALVVDWAVYIMLIRAIAGVRPPRRDLFLGALIGAVGSGVIRALGTTVVGAVDDPVLASFAALITLLLWVNLVARVALMVCAFTANPPAPDRPETPEEVHLYSTPNYVTVSDPATTEWEYQPVTGTVLPDETLRPGFEPEPEPHRSGLVGWWQRRRIARLENRLAEVRERYAQGARTQR